MIRSILADAFRRRKCDFIYVSFAASVADITMALGFALKEREEYDKFRVKRDLSTIGEFWRS